MSDRVKKDTFVIKQKEVSQVVNGLFQRADIPTAPKIEQNWSEVDAMFQSIGEGMIEIGYSINECIQTIKAAKLEETVELTVTINGLKNDIENFSIDLKAINSRHEGMTGPVKDGDELALCLSVFNDYVILNDRFRAVVFPALLTVTEYVSEAMRKYNAEKAAAATVTEQPAEQVTEIQEEKVNTNE